MVCAGVHICTLLWVCQVQYGTWTHLVQAWLREPPPRESHAALALIHERNTEGVSSFGLSVEHGCRGYKGVLCVCVCMCVCM